MSAELKATEGPLSETELQRVHAWWRAANYLAVGQIYLLDNPLLTSLSLSSTLSHGFWGTGVLRLDLNFFTRI